MGIEGSNPSVSANYCRQIAPLIKTSRSRCRFSRLSRRTQQPRDDFCFGRHRKTKRNDTMTRSKTLQCLMFFAAVAMSTIPPRAFATQASVALETCRATIGRPVVRACIQQHMQSAGGFPAQYLAECRATASPAVRGCFQAAMKNEITACRQSVGRPIVQECVRSRIAVEGGFRPEQVEACRKNAYGPVKACVWKTSAVND